MNASTSLFPDTPARMPLTERLRSHSADDVIGQQHLPGSDKPLHVAFASGESHSIVLWGPPGVGKTVLARLTANAFDAEFIALSAMLSSIRGIYEAAERTEQLHIHDHRTLIFIDEVHRFNRGQQDTSLPRVESGLFTFIGATMENPSLEVDGALLSRAAVYTLKSLSDDGLKQPAERTRQELGGLEWTPVALNAIVVLTNGDGRKLLNNIEVVARAVRTQADDDTVPAVDEALLVSVLPGNLHRFDRDGDAFYDQINALHKSAHGSDPDDTLYQLCRVLDGGTDPRYLARHIVRMAWEDIGLADPRAGRITLDAAETYKRLDSPEGELALTQTTIYLAIAPKSNTGYSAYSAARAFVGQGKSRNVPMHLRNTSTRLMREPGYGHACRYAHDGPKAYTVGETYFPNDLPTQNWYIPAPHDLEDRIGKRLRHLCELDAQWHTEQDKSSRNK